jgi:N-acetylglucosaminyldiphosphoundecaprenol N-acetyl-beta-D-mannosaminyltransferase
MAVRARTLEAGAQAPSAEGAGTGAGAGAWTEAGAGARTEAEAGADKRNVLGVLVDAVDYATVLDRVVEAAHRPGPLSVSALAVHGVMTGVQDPEHRYRLNHIDIVAPDGQPVRWALNLLHGTGLDDTVAGPMLTARLCEAAASHSLPVFFYGSSPATLGPLVARLTRRFPGLRVAGCEPSKFRPLAPEETAAAIDRIRSSGARITFVGLGCPRQESFVHRFRDELGMPAVAVGAAFDVHAGLLRRPPVWMQRAGLEWLARLGHEPRRLWRRYLVLNPTYLGLLALQALDLWRPDPDHVRPPATDLVWA